MPLEKDLREDERWRFDGDVADAFDDMLERSIPELATVRELAFEVGSRFVIDRTAIVDLGTSRGDMLDPFVRRFGARNSYVGVEVSEPFLEIARSRFELWIEGGDLEVLDLDLRTDYPSARASLVVAFLTLQFVPIEHRARVVARAFDSLVAGGAIVVVEKVLGGSARIDDVLVDLYHDRKRKAGYSPEEISRKALSLEGVLVPLTFEGNEAMLAGAGFGPVEGFWRCLNFAAWVGVKG